MSDAICSVITGRIAYRGADGVPLGEERFDLIEYDGGRSLRAICEMHDIGLLRDVSIAMDDNWLPLDGFSRITRAGRPVASSWFRVDAGSVHVESMIHGAGRMTQAFRNDPSITYLGLHPLQGDALVTARAAHDRVGEQTTVRALTNSIAENGDRGHYATPVSIEVAFLGEENLDVAAGGFRARKFALRWSPDWPPAHIWVRREDCIFLKLTWSQISNWYELVELHERAKAPARSDSSIPHS